MRVRSGIFSMKYALTAFTCCAWLLVILLSTGGGGFLAKDGAIDSRATGAIIVYWALIMLIGSFFYAWQKHRSEALLMLFSLIVAAVLGEMLLRTFRLFPGYTLLPQYGLRSSKYHHVLPPNKTMSAGPIGKKYYVISTNEDGFRSPHSLDEFRKKDLRIAILGDSFTFGLGVDDDATFPAVLERSLQRMFKGKSIGVLNAGITSYSPLLENKMYLGKVRNYKPQIVILMFDATDIGDDIIYDREQHRSADSLFFAADDPDTVTYSGALVQMVRQHLAYPFLFLPRAKEVEIREPSSRKKYNYYEFDLDVGGVHETNRFFIYRHPLDITHPYFESTFATIRQLADSVHTDGALFMLFVPPRYHHWNPNECPDDAQRPKYKVNEPYQFEYLNFFERKRDSAAFPIVNMLPAFQATKKFPLVFRDDAHWNEEGNRLVAETLVDYLLTSGNIKK